MGLLLVAALVVIGASVALAFWTASDSSNPAVAAADSLPQGNRPSSAVVGPDPNSNTVTVSFGQATTIGGVSVPAENTVLRRAPESGGAGTTVTALCSGSVTVVCTESGVPDGRWVYTGFEQPKGQPVRRETPKIGRNDPCPCGSGKKYKKCCGVRA